MEHQDYAPGNVVELKKEHPCGSKTWEILRLGADIKLKCTGCDHIVMIPRSKFNKTLKGIISEKA